jgi:ElaB/YqjD/DUF883 family membrane-anchored ribosome-binding protein
MSENKAFEQEEKSLIPVNPVNGEDQTHDYMNEFKAQADEYGQKLQDAALKAKDYASERFVAASEKFKELQDRDPRELAEYAKEFARQKPGQTILISAAVGLVVGLILRGRR